MKFNEKVHKELNKLFKLANEKFYDNELPTANILVQSSGARKNVLSWCTTKEIWEIGGTDYYEIVLTAEYLNREFAEVATTLFHEMVHLYNLISDVKDTSGTEYHNKKFKDEAERRGLKIERANRIGWSVTTLADETKVWLENVDVDKRVFDAVRKIPARPRKKAQRTYTYTCHGCNEKILSKNPVLTVTCDLCNMGFDRPL